MAGRNAEIQISFLAIVSLLCTESENIPRNNLCLMRKTTMHLPVSAHGTQALWNNHFVYC